MPLEPRIVYDASVAAGAVAAHHPHPNVVERAPADRIGSNPTALSHSNTAPIHMPAPERPAPTPQSTTMVASSPRNDLNPTREWLATAQSHLPQSRLGLSPRTSSESQVVFIDPNVTDYQSLVAGLPPGTRYVVLNPNEDGFAQIASYLQSHPGVDAIHLVSHGSEGQVEAGKTVLDLGDLSAYSAELAQIGAAMKPGGDFLIYGCDVAEGSDGQALVQQIAALTHLNVAASATPVGATSLGGSWSLNYDVGNVRTPVIFSAAAEQQYPYLFTQIVESFTNPDDNGYDSGLASSFSLDGITYTITKTGALASNTVTQDPNLQSLADETGSDNALLFDEFGSGGISAITITMTNGSHFNIASLDLDGVADANITVLANGVSTGISIVSNGNFVTQTIGLSTANSAFNNVTSITIQGGNLVPTIGHIVYSIVAPPTVTTTGGATTFTSADSSTGTPVAVDSGLSVSDTGATTGSSATVSITGNFHSGQDVLAFTNTSSTTYGNIAGSYTAATGVLTLTSSGSTATTAQWQHALEAVTYLDTAAAPNTSARTVSFTYNDGGASSTAVTKTVNVNSPPIVTTTGGTTNYTDGASATAVDSGVTVTDPGQSTQASGTVVIAGGFHSGDALAFTNTSSTTFGNISAVYNSSTGVLTLTSSGGTATDAQWQHALDAITFSSTSTNHSNRTISFTVNDGTTDSAASNKTVAVVDAAPVVTTTGGTTSYVGGTTAVSVDGGVTVSDFDNTSQSSGTVSISGGFDSGNDVLSFTNTSGVLFGNISVSYNSGTGVLTLTSAGATATKAQWANAFDAVTFSSTSTTYGNRTVSFVVNDGTNNSTAATKTVDVLAPPTIITDSGSAAFVAGDNATSTPVAVDSGVTLSDGGASAFASATVSITGHFASGEDVLSFTNTSSSTLGNISASYNAGTGVLTLTSSGASATTAQWQAALEAVTYTDTAVTPNNLTRTISFAATDSNGNSSNTATRIVTVADTDQTPVVTTSGGTTSYVGASSPVMVDGGVSVSDLDNATQSSGAVSITGGFHSGDSLSFTNTTSILFGNISASYNSGTGVLTLTSSGAIATRAQWSNAFDAVTFSSTSTTYGNRTVSFAVSDGTKTSTAATDTVAITAPPILTPDSGSADFVAGDNVTSTPVAVDSGLTLTDGSATTLGSATVAITGSLVSGEDVLAFTNNGSTMGNISGSYDASTGILTLTSSGATATLAQWQAALDAVTYTDTAVTPNHVSRTVSFTAVDGAGNTSHSATRIVTVTDTDQTPIVTTTGGTTSYMGSTSATTVDGGVTVSDLDNTTQSSGTVSITGGFHSGDSLSFTNTSATLFGNISASYNSGTGVLTLTSSGASATDAQWANALDSVTFSSTSTTYGNRTVSFAVSDGTKNSTAATKTVDVLNPTPVLTADSGSAAFVAADNATSTPVTVDAGLTLTDPATSTLASATIAITGNFQSGEDVLAYTNDGATMGNIAASYNASTGVLTLTSAGASATLAQWQAALDSVAYTDTAVTPNNTTRTVSFTVTDANFNTSNTATRTVTITDTDQTPIVSVTGGTTNYVGGTSATTIDGGVSVSDLDNTTQSTGTVSITSGFHSGDTLTYVNTSSTLFGNIVGSYNAATGVLTLTSSGGTASNAQWADAFSAITFSASASAMPGNRTVSFVVNDGTENSTAATDTVDVLGPPTITADSGSASFVAGDNVTSTPIAVDSGLTVTDGSSPTLVAATISVTGNFHSGEDVLAYTNDGSTMGNIAGSYNASSGVLTLTSAGASATLAQWQAALDSVTYTDTAVTPSNTTRTISFAVADANSNTSNTATRTVTVTDTDQTPIVSVTGGMTNYVGGTSAATIDGSITVSDLDNTTQSTGTVSIASGFHGGDTLTFVNTNSTTFGNIVASYNAATGVLTLTSSGDTATDTQWSHAFGAVTFSASSSATPGNRTVSFVVNDGTENSTAATDTVDVLGPPTITTDSGSAAFMAGDNVTSTPVTVDSGLTVTDGSSPTLAAATIAITGNFHSGEDVLGFTNSSSTTFGNIASSYNAGTGVLTLASSGNSATLAQWQAALDAVTYTDTVITPNNATRTVSFAVVDTGANTSNTATRTVTITDTDQTPIVTTTSGTTGYIDGTAPVTIDGGMTVSDRDNATQSSGTVSVSAGFNGGDTLSFTNTSSTLYGNIVASYNSGTGVLTLTSSGATATDAQWQSAFEAVTFSAPSVSVAGNRTISFVVNDGTENSAAGMKTVSVINSNPVIITDTGAAAFVAGDNVQSTPVAVDSGITVTDVGSSTLQSGTVAITGSFHPGEDVLSFANDGSTMGNITGSYNAATGVLTLTSAGGSATLAQWQAAFQEVTYTDTAITPDNTTRTISFTATDGNGITGSAATRAVTVQDTDQTPTIVTTGATTSYVGGTSAVTIDAGVSVNDRDNPTLASGTVSIRTGFNSGDTLSFTNSSATLYGNITASYDAATGVLTLTSAGATATTEQWANTFDAVRFSAGTTAAPGNRVITYVVNDGTKDSVAATDTLALTAPPIVTADTGSAAFVAGDNVTSTPVAVDSGLTLADASSATLSSATVSITGNFHGGEDVLAFTNDSSTMGNITGSYNATTGVLTLASAGGTATLAQWQAAFHEVTYDDVAITPDSSTRTISFAVTDSNANSSNTATRTVTVQDTDQTPIVSTTAGNTAYQANSTAKLVDSGVTVGDRDSSTLASATVSITGGFESGDRLSLAASSAQAIGNITGSYDVSTGVLTLTSSGATATLAEWQQALAAVQFVSSPSAIAGTRTVSYRVNDGMKPSAPAAKIIDVQQAAFAPPVIQPEIIVVAPQGGEIQQVPAEPIVVEALNPVHPVGTTFPTGTVAFFGTQGTDMSGVMNESIVTTGSMDVPVWVAPPLRSFTPPVPTTIESFNVTAGESFTLTLVSGVEVEQADGSPLPDWLHYDTTSGVLKGTPPSNAPQEMRLITTVHRGATVISRHEVTIDIGAHKAAHPHRSNGHRSPPHADVPAAKPSLAEQFARQRGKFHVARADSRSY